MARVRGDAPPRGGGDVVDHRLAAGTDEHFAAVVGELPEIA